MDPFAFLREFGLPIALCVVLILAMRHQNTQLQRAFAALIKAQADRIGALEGIAQAQGERISTLEDDRLKRADEYAHSLKDVAGRYATAVREWHAWMEKAWASLMHLAAARGDYAPHHQHDTPPPPPHERGTDTIGGKA